MTVRSLLVIMLMLTYSCQAQTNNNMKPDNITNPLLCDPEKGFCEIPGTASSDSIQHFEQKKQVKIIYFTDPICSSCWGIEPQLRKLKLEYGNLIEIEYRMGGLLPDWSYNSGGISKPSDVAHHWDEVSAYYNMPIDGDIWLEDPLSSSYPPSIAFKAAQLQNEEKAVKFLRRIREMVFLEKLNITKWENISKAAAETGLDVEKLKADYESAAQKDFQADLDLSRKMGVRGFPTLIFVDSSGNQRTVYGFKPYAVFEKAIAESCAMPLKSVYDASPAGLFAVYPTLTLREYSELSGKSLTESEVILQKLTDEKRLVKTVTKNGAIWKIKL